MIELETFWSSKSFYTRVRSKRDIAEKRAKEENRVGSIQRVKERARERERARREREREREKRESERERKE